MTTPVTRGLHHVTLTTANVGRSLAFYRDLLGLSVVKKTVNFDDPETHHVYLGDAAGTPGTLLTFFEWPRAGRGHWGVGGVHHVALGVKDAEAQLRWKRRLMDARVRVTGPYDRGYFRSLYFQDPDGQVLELATAGPGYAVDEPADRLGQELVVPDPSRLPGGRNEESIRAQTHPEPVPEVTPDMALTGIHHVTGITEDLEAAHEFCSGALGLRLVKRTLNQDDARTKHYFWAHYDGERVAPRSTLTLFGWPGSRFASRPGTGQAHHVAFRAADETELQEWREHLLALGVEVTPVLDRRYFRSISFSAPDGLLLEIATDAPGFTVDEDAGDLGSDLKLPPWLEGDRGRIESRLTPIR